MPRDAAAEAWSSASGALHHPGPSPGTSISMFVSISIAISTYTYMCTYIHIHIYAYVCYIHIYIRVCVCVYTAVATSCKLSWSWPCQVASPGVEILTSVYNRIHTYVCVYIYIYIDFFYIHIQHTYIYTHKLEVKFKGLVKAACALLDTASPPTSSDLAPCPVKSVGTSTNALSPSDYSSNGVTGHYHTYTHIIHLRRHKDVPPKIVNCYRIGRSGSDTLVTWS